MDQHIKMKDTIGLPPGEKDWPPKPDGYEPPPPPRVISLDLVFGLARQAVVTLRTVAVAKNLSEVATAMVAAKEVADALEFQLDALAPVSEATAILTDE